MPRLYTLDLSNNSITLLSSTFFGILMNLEYLFLQFNSFMTASLTVEADMLSLSYLNILPHSKVCCMFLASEGVCLPSVTIESCQDNIHHKSFLKAVALALVVLIFNV